MNAQLELEEQTALEESEARSTAFLLAVEAKRRERASLLQQERDAKALSWEI